MSQPSPDGRTLWNEGSCHFLRASARPLRGLGFGLAFGLCLLATTNLLSFAYELSGKVLTITNMSLCCFLLVLHLSHVILVEHIDRLIYLQEGRDQAIPEVRKVQSLC